MKVLFYSDSPTFGGHEAQTVLAAHQLATRGQCSVAFMCGTCNGRLLHRLQLEDSGGENLRVIAHEACSKSFQGIRTFFGRRQIGALGKAIRMFDPDVVLVSQGTIEISTLGLMASLRSGFPTVSYIPFAHTFHSMGIHLGYVRDLLDRAYYQCPDAFVTSSAMAAQCLADWGVPQHQIWVVENGIDVDAIPFVPRRTRDNEEFTFGLIGRIAMKQKGHDLMVRAVAENRGLLGKCKIAVIGDGPDEEELKEKILACGVSDRVRIEPWTTNILEAFERIDALLIPSRYEGVPVVMQEAMAYGLPIAGSKIPGINEFLPPAWLFPVGDTAAMAETLVNIKNMDNADWLVRNREFVVRECSRQRFGEKMENVLKHYARQQRAHAITKV